MQRFPGTNTCFLVCGLSIGMESANEILHRNRVAYSRWKGKVQPCLSLYSFLLSPVCSPPWRLRLRLLALPCRSLARLQCWLGPASPVSLSPISCAAAAKRPVTKKRASCAKQEALFLSAGPPTNGPPPGILRGRLGTGGDSQETTRHGHYGKNRPPTDRSDD